jgi:hypothetical protein
MHSEPAPKSRFETAPPTGAVRLESVAFQDHLVPNTLIASASRRNDLLPHAIPCAPTHTDRADGHRRRAFGRRRERKLI